MANKNDYYFKQTVSEAELDSGFDKLEDADHNVMTDQLLQGIFQGAAVTEQLTPALTVDVDGPSLVYDQVGRRIFWSPVQAVDCSTDESGNPTTVVGGGNAKILSIFAEFDRLLSDPRIDGNGATVFFNRDESFKLNVVQGAEATSGAEVAPPLRASQILLCDITILNGTTQIFDADIDLVGRRQDVFVLTGSPNSEREGTTNAVLQAFQDQINAFIGGALAASSVTFAGSGNWADGTANPAGDVEAQLDKIVSDLATGAGSAKVITAAGPAWADATTNPAERLDQRIDSIVSDLATGSGTAKVQSAAGPAWHDATTNPAERLDERLDSIINDLVANNGADRIGVQASTGGLVTAGGSIHDAINELEAGLALVGHSHGVATQKFMLSKEPVTPGLTSDMRIALTSSGDDYQMKLEGLPQGAVVTGFAFYGEHSAAEGADITLFKQTWGDATGTSLGSGSSTDGPGNVVAGIDTTDSAVDGGSNWFVRVTNNGVGTLWLHSIDIQF